VAARLRETATRLAGIEIQTGPYAVAELRVAEALHRHKAGIPAGGLRLYVADTLDDPFAEQAHLAATMAPIAASRRNANKMKADEPVVVVIGNPPYRERAKGHGGFVEHGAKNSNWEAPLLDEFREPGNGKNEYVLSNLYVYFWRWATWKVFDAHPGKTDGVVCFITTSGYLKGRGFAGMRRYLREHASDGWVIDCTPEGHQPDVATRIFGGVQQPVCIGIFVRRADTDLTTPATIHYRAVHGKQADKFGELGELQLDGPAWEPVPSDWTAPFLPKGAAAWDESPSLGDLLPWQAPGIKPNRTWVYAPLASTLTERWNRLIAASGDEQKQLFRETTDSAADKRKPGLVGFAHADVPVDSEHGAPIPPVPVSYRSFDVQYVIPDDRLMHRPSPDLWRVRGDHQVYVAEQNDQEVKGGPGLTFGAFTPDMHFYAGRGGRVLPLYASADISKPNLAPGLLDFLAERLGHAVTPEDFLAYVAATTAHPAFTQRFVEDLRTPGIRVPMTSDPALWSEAVTIGRRVLWLHTRGERCTDPDAGRPAGPPDVTDAATRPMVTVGIPVTHDLYPDELEYDATTQTLSVGEGRIAHVPQQVVDYEVSGMNILRKWFGYRKATRPRTGREQSALDDVRPDTWPSAYTTDLVGLLRVLTLVVDLEPSQAELLEKVMEGPRITVTDLTEAGVLPVPDAARTPLPKVSKVALAGQTSLEFG
jgi:predicted helicase